MIRPDITYIGDFEFPDGNAAALRVKTNIQLLAGLGYAVHAVGRTKNKQYDQHEDGFKKLSLRNHLLDSAFKRFLYYLNPLYGLNKSEKSASIFICYNLNSIGTLVVLFYSRIRCSKMVVDLTEWYDYRPIRTIRNAVKQVDVFVRMRLINWFTDGIISISTFLADYYNGVKGVTIPPLISNDEFESIRVARDTPETLKLCFVGTIGVNKESLNEIIEMISLAVDQLKIPVIFEIAGITDNQLVNCLIDSEPVNDLIKLKCHGKISRSKVLSLIQSSCFSIIYRVDNRVNKAGYSTKFVESVTCGTPVIVSEVGDYGKLCRERRLGLVLDSTKSKNEIVYELVGLLRVWQGEWSHMHRACLECDVFDMNHYNEHFHKFFRSLNIS